MIISAKVLLKIRIMTLTKIHVVISLIGIVTGVVVLIGLISGRRFNGWTAWFLASTVATSATGFFPFPWRYTRNYCWHYLVTLAGSGNLCPILSKICRGVAMDLRGYCDDCPLSECVRFDRAALSESAIPESPGANSN